MQYISYHFSSDTKISVPGMNLVSFLPSEELPDALGPVPAPDPAPATLVTVGPHHVPQHQRVAVHLPAALVQRQGLTLTATLRTLLGKIVLPTKNKTFNCFTFIRKHCPGLPGQGSSPSWQGEGAQERLVLL